MQIKIELDYKIMKRCLMMMSENEYEYSIIKNEIIFFFMIIVQNL